MMGLSSWALLMLILRIWMFVLCKRTKQNKNNSCLSQMHAWIYGSFKLKVSLISVAYWYGIHQWPDLSPITINKYQKNLSRINGKNCIYFNEMLIREFGVYKGHWFIAIVSTDQPENIHRSSFKDHWNAHWNKTRIVEKGTDVYRVCHWPCPAPCVFAFNPHKAHKRYYFLHFMDDTPELYWC